MVAYSFRPQSEEDIVTLKKRQTVRGNRKRHARPGEAMQLYTGMRTKYCRKLLDHDPVCLDVRPILIDIAPRHPNIIVLIEIDGIRLPEAEIEAFAIADGFARTSDDSLNARQRMGWFWLRDHGAGVFDGVVIRWEPSLG